MSHHVASFVVSTPSRLLTERKRVKQLVPYAVVFPYIKMGRSISGSVVAEDGLSVRLKVEGLVQGHLHDFDLQAIRSVQDEKLLHHNAYDTLNEIPVDEAKSKNGQ